MLRNLKLAGKPAGWPALQATEEEAARRLRLIAAAERVREQLIAPDNGALLPEFRFGPELANAEGLYGLQMRVVACESLYEYFTVLYSYRFRVQYIVYGTCISLSVKPYLMVVTGYFSLNNFEYCCHTSSASYQRTSEHSFQNIPTTYAIVYSKQV